MVQPSPLGRRAPDDEPIPLDEIAKGRLPYCGESDDYFDLTSHFDSPTFLGVFLAPSQHMYRCPEMVKARTAQLFTSSVLDSFEKCLDCFKNVPLFVLKNTMRLEVCDLTAIHIV